MNGDRPFNLADLLYVVAHEGHPGHIAEMVLKEMLEGRTSCVASAALGETSEWGLISTPCV